MAHTFESVPCRPLRSRYVRLGIWRSACNPASPNSFPPIVNSLRFGSAVSRSNPTSVIMADPTLTDSSVVMPEICSSVVSLIFVP